MVLRRDAKSDPLGDAFALPGILAVGAGVALTVVAASAWRRWGRRDLIPGPKAFGATEAGRAQFYAIVPLILGIHVSVPLFVLALQGQMFSPNNHLHGPWIYWLGVAQIGVALALLYGAL